MATNIILAIGVIFSGLIAFFMFAIWRAILGKSSVDLQLSTNIRYLMDKIEALNKGMTNYSTIQGNVGKELKDLGKTIETLVDETARRDIK